MRKQMKALEEKNVTYMKETMNLQEVSCCLMGNCLVVDLCNVSERSHSPTSFHLSEYGKQVGGTIRSSQTATYVKIPRNQNQIQL